MYLAPCTVYEHYFNNTAIILHFAYKLSQLVKYVGKGKHIKV